MMRGIPRGWLLGAVFCGAAVGAIRGNVVRPTPAAQEMPQFDVRAFGAVGDSLTDDCAAIQAAIDSCVAAGGGVVDLGAGIYLLGGVLSLRENVRLVGEDAELITTTNASHIDIPPGSRVIRITNIHFKTHGRIPGTDGRAAVRINSAEAEPAPFDIEISNCTFTGLVHCAVSGALSTDVRVRNNLIRDVGEHGIYAAAGADRWLISGNVIAGSDTTRPHHAGIKITGMGVTVHSNSIVGMRGRSSSAGILVEYSAGPVIVSGNRVADCTEGIRIGYASNITVEGNTFRDNHLDGYFGDVTFRSAAEADRGLANIVIKGNEFHGSSRHGEAAVFYNVDGYPVTEVRILDNCVSGSYVNFFGGTSEGFTAKNTRGPAGLVGLSGSY